MISDKRLQQIVDYVKEHGIYKATKEFGVEEESILRYLRRYFQNKGDAKILIFDIETSTIRADVFGVWGQNIQPHQILEDRIMIGFSAKWLDDSEIHKYILTPREIKKRSDKRIVKALWKLFDEADIIVAHNGDRFDIPISNTRFIENGLKRPSPYRSIDTFKISKHQFGWVYNRLDWLGERLGLGRKRKVDYELWQRCMTGDKEALNEMMEYNAQDVFLLEDVYYALRGWANNHPNINPTDTGLRCRVCGSIDLTPKGQYRTNANIYQSYQCRVCNGFTRVSAKKYVPVAK